MDDQLSKFVIIRDGDDVLMGSGENEQETVRIARQIFKEDAGVNVGVYKLVGTVKFSEPIFEKYK